LKLKFRDHNLLHLDCAFDTERSSRKKKRSRKQSRSNILLGAIKKELKEVEANPAIKKHRKIKSGTPKTVRTNLERFKLSRNRNSQPNVWQFYKTIHKYIYIYI
jgi:hypothetical protein